MKTVAQDTRLVQLAVLMGFVLGMQAISAPRGSVPSIIPSEPVQFSEPERGNRFPAAMSDGRCIADGSERRNTNRLLDERGNFLTAD